MAGLAAASVAAVMAVGVQAQTQGQGRSVPAVLVPMAKVPQPVSDAIRASWESASKNIKDSAADVSQAIHDFKPVETVRTFGQIVAHVAGANYEFCAAARGEQAPNAEAAFDALTAKADIIKAFDESVAYCDVAFRALTDQTAGQTIDMPFGMGKAARIAALTGNVGHLNEHYGNLVTYMRIKGIVPPTSRR
jgi:uncharacterized damage-inducible protein DinB